jgi:hypothetical protein
MHGQVCAWHGVLGKGAGGGLGGRPVGPMYHAANSSCAAATAARAPTTPSHVPRIRGHVHRIAAIAVVCMTRDTVTPHWHVQRWRQRATYQGEDKHGALAFHTCGRCMSAHPCETLYAQHDMYVFLYCYHDVAQLKSTAQSRWASQSVCT